jgi:peroxiredoxin
LLVPGATALAVVLLLAATLVFTRQAPSSAEASCAAKGATTGLTVGACAPNFTLAEPDGHRVSLADFHGQPVLIHFWAVACTTCAGEYPDFSRAVAADQSKGLRVLAVDAWGEPGTMVQQWRRSHHLPATFLIDQPEAVVRQYGVQGTPTTFFIDRSGHIKAANSGPLSYAAFQQNVGKIV